MEPENAETTQNTVEKPKKKREPTPAQLENLAKMRTKKQIQAAARKMLEKSATPPAPAAPQAPAASAATSAPDPADVLRVAEDVKYIREYIAKKAAAKEAKAASRRAVDEETHEDELAKYRAYTAQLRNNLLR